LFQHFIKEDFMKRFFLFNFVCLSIILIFSYANADFYVVTTGKKVGTEINSLPYTISSPGFYFISKNLTSASDGIVVNSDNVTIDLMGFTINGPEGGGDGIYFDSKNNVEIRNGGIKDFSYGIRGVTDGQSNKVIAVKTISNGGYGIFLKGNNHGVKDCTVIGCGAYGIYVPDAGGHTIKGNTVSGSRYYGIVAGPGSTVMGNNCNNNDQHGINALGGCTVINNTVYNNALAGIILDSNGNSVINNTAYNNNQSGSATRGGIVLLGNENLVKNNTATSNLINNIYVSGNSNSIEENLLTGSSYGIIFQNTGNFYDNNRAANNTNDYYNSTGNTDGGNNVSF
jgi:parallel beta-helix repeat protein